MSAPNHDGSFSTSSPHSIAIIGAGPVGVALAKRLVKAGHTVCLSNSRGPDTLRQQERETGAKSADVKQAIAEAEIIVLAIPTGNISAFYPILRATSLRPGSILLDACNYYPSRDGRVEELDKGLPDSVWISQNVSVPVVKAFNNIIAANIFTSARTKRSAGRVALPVSADDTAALDIVMALVEDVGFDAYNAGKLADTWRYQPGQPAYCTEPSAEQLPRLLARADRDQGPANRDKAREWIDKLPADFPPDILLRVARLSNGLDKWNVRSWFAATVFAFALLRASMKG
ncbi:hypothetical protein M409DRAFT_23627 [Zasmidium cellare ATCC 36951]|uniref:Pyrroline-5-carboxylate reductase catalytic N-terminal domain-containing protein n=1 Tax=Zasmidium cellare ATCC 36951 TaxID=1080233 RepID=A0A6A6CFI3_ZASCE|nr:uncharacterized protein M409DRAFT_23627 [Zasmidium cellare ATCC 36951]KAF2165895.1 hypothetical protein M409DRAFT_23627 [Zasmidium cellare ATCC 36951]